MTDQLKNIGMTYLPKITDEILDDYENTDLIDIESFGPNWSQIAVDFACLLDNTRHIPEGYQLVKVDDIKSGCRQLRSIALRAKAPNRLTPEVIMWAHAFEKAMLKAAGDQDD